MNETNPYLFLIGLCIVIIVSFFYNIIARKTNIPSVLLLIATGFGIQQLLQYFNITPDYSAVLEILGIVGVIMIVLEAALDLELAKKKWPLIWKSFAIASLSLVITALALSFLMRLFIPGIDFLPALVYAIPLSILSSSIIIPSVTNLAGYKKEFLIYEGTFSDILGIMIFYMIIENLDVQGMSELTLVISSNLLLTILASAVLSYVLLFIIQNIRGNAKFFLFLAALILLYSVGKLFHLSSLIIILMFGLLLRNHKLLLFQPLEDWLKDERIDEVFDEFKMITAETSFLVRTFFFVVFGMTLPLSSVINYEVWMISGIFLIVAYLFRFILFLIIEKKQIVPQIFIAPRGLISVLLFFAIPESLKREQFESGVLFVVIIVTSLIMAWSLIATGKQLRGENQGDIENN